MGSELEKIEAYLANVPADKRAALETLRRQIRQLAPQAEECFSYGMPAFKQGKGLAAYAAAKNHCALYPMSSAIVPLLQSELAGFKTSIGTIQFTVDSPLPEALVTKIIKARLAEIATQMKPSANSNRVI
jgi:uncharacterized protein YdhG (YjbR/CyaY superfamily)